MKRPERLAGRDNAIERAAVALDRLREGLAARSLIFYGLRGVGKTVLLNRIRVDAESRGMVIHQHGSARRTLTAGASRPLSAGRVAGARPGRGFQGRIWQGAPGPGSFRA
jgi:putative ribosome biogenesis GTPase RsgA